MQVRKNKTDRIDAEIVAKVLRLSEYQETSILDEDILAFVSFAITGSGWFLPAVISSVRLLPSWIRSFPNTAISSPMCSEWPQKSS